jgi:dethiobiotin synthetase
MMRSVFVTSTATNSGKTYLTRGLARSLLRRGKRPVALKPLETGVTTDPLDAAALARACARPELATAPGFVRASLPLAPYAAALEAMASPPRVASLVAAIRSFDAPENCLLVEGAGGLLVPIDERDTMAELARALRMPLLVIAPDRLGVLSDVLTCVESARARELHVLAVILAEHTRSADDPSPRTNRRILADRLACPVLSMPACRDDDDALADAVEAAGITALLDDDAIARRAPSA